MTLDGLRVADYPGRGRHRVLFDFAARNQTDADPEQLHFNATYPVEEGEQAAVVGRPIFAGLQVGAEGLFLQCATVNVLNEGDEALLGFLDGDAFHGGLQLLTTAQPTLAPFVALTVQIPQTLRTVWDWADWGYDRASGHLVSTEDRGLLIPYNYFVVSISGCHGP